jgi:uncharacterized protein YecE (DUF72 family)
LPPEPLLPAAVNAEHRELAAGLPGHIRLGTMSWSYAGWRGVVYAPETDVQRLARDGLPAYAAHPLLRAVEVDRTYYEPLPVEVFQEHAAQTPEDFRFLVKAHQECSIRRFPVHARYGSRRGEPNARYLDASYAADAVIGPIAEGLGAKLGAVLFQFPPHEPGSAEEFAGELAAFLDALPRSATYAVEVRNPELVTPAYAQALSAAGAVHCHNVWGDMPSVLRQAKLLPPLARRPLVIRWLMRRGEQYEQAGARFKPFDRVVDEDPGNRGSIATLVAKAAARDVPSLVLVDNKAEGCAPESIVRLARAIHQSA